MTNPVEQTPKSRLRLPIIKTGSVIGRDHLRLNRNNQDSFCAGLIHANSKNYYYGVVCDGCSGRNALATKNEVGAQLMAYFAVKEITAMLLMGSTIDRIADALYSRCLGYLHAIASLTSAGNPQEAVSFVSNYLCCTIVGFVMDDESAVIFSAGDGVIMIDDRINRINQDDRPSYLGLSLVDSRFLKLDGVELPKSFNIQEIELGQINRFAVCTDGVTDGILKQVFGLAGPHSGPLGLQRKLRVLTLREEPVEDDCTVITIELNEPEADKLVIELAVSDDCKEKEVER